MSTATGATAAEHTPVDLRNVIVIGSGPAGTPTAGPTPAPSS